MPGMKKLNGDPRLHVGPLRYAMVGLLWVFVWLLCGDFCFTVMEYVNSQIVPLRLRELNAPDWVLPIILTTVPIIISFTLNILVNPTLLKGTRASLWRIVALSAILLGFGPVSALAIPDTATNRYATAADAAYWPTVNVGDYIFFKATSGSAIYARTSPAISLPVGGKILIWGGDYTRIYINGTGCQSTASQPTIITNLGGQVRWGCDTTTSIYRGLELDSFANVFLTGKYDPAAKTGDPNYLGHNGGANMGSGNYYEQYGLWGNERWSAERAGVTAGANMVRISGFQTCKVSYVAAWGGGFSGFNIKAESPPVPGRVAVDIQDCFSGFSSGEAFYIGNTGVPANEDVTCLTMRNNIVAFAGTEAYQFSLLTADSVIENNVAVGSAMFYRIPFMDFFQQGLLQLSFVEGGVMCRNNIMTGGGAGMMLWFYNDPGPGRAAPSASSTNVFENNYMGYNHYSAGYVSAGDGITPYLFNNNVFGPCSTPQDNDAYTSNKEPRASIQVANYTNPITFSGNCFDPARPGFYVDNLAASNVASSQNVAMEAPLVQFKNLGFTTPDFRRFSFWAPTYKTTEKLGQYIPYKAGDCVIYYDSAGNTNFFRCLADHISSAGGTYNPNTSPTQWQQLTWNGRNMPPLDVRIVPDTCYNYRGMGLQYNEPNTTGSDTTAPVIIAFGGDMSIAKGSSFVDPGWQAIDNKDGDISGQVVTWWSGAPIDANTAGEYRLCYKVADAAGNVSDYVTRVITVSDPNVTYGKYAKINMHHNAPVHSTYPDWCDLGNNTTGLTISLTSVPTSTTTAVYDVSNAATGWTLLIDCVSGGYSQHYNTLTNTAGTAIEEFPAAVTKCGISVRDPFNIPCVFVFSGMDPTRCYDVRFTGYISSAKTAAVNAKLTDSISGRSDSINVQSNTAAIGSVRSVKPDATGKLQLVFTTDTPCTTPNISGITLQEKSGFGSATSAPAIAGISNQTTGQNTPVSGIPVVLSDSDSSPNALQVWARSSNPAVVLDSGVTVTGTGLARTLGIQPQAGASGTATITLIVSDGFNASNVSFLVSVQAVLAGNVFFQDFESSQTASSYFAASAPNVGQLNDISAKTSGGSWAINGGRLQLARLGISGTANGAGFTRWADFAGPPSVLYATMDFGVSNFNSYQTGAMTMDFANVSALADYNSSTAAVSIFASLIVDGTSSNSFKFRISGNSSAAYAADGTLYALSLYLNKSGTSQQYCAPDGSAQTLLNNCVSLWVGNSPTALQNVAASNGASSTLTDLRARWATADAATWSFDNIKIYKELPAPATLPPASSLAAWRQLQGLAGDGSQDLATPAGDNVSNLMKYALNMAPSAGDLSLPAYLMPAGGISGLPCMDVDGAGNLTYTFVRRNAGSNPGIAYSVVQSSDVVTWDTCAAIPSVTAIDSVWERVSYVVDSTSSSKTFLRLNVTRP